MIGLEWTDIDLEAHLSPAGLDVAIRLLDDAAEAPATAQGGRNGASEEARAEPGRPSVPHLGGICVEPVLFSRRRSPG
jgi:hypothetical protein